MKEEKEICPTCGSECIKGASEGTGYYRPMNIKPNTMKKSKLPLGIQTLADAIDKKGLKVQLGLEAQGHIQTIETELARWNYGAKVEIRYTKEVWDQIGEKIGWLPFTAALNYWRYLDKKRDMHPTKQTEEEEAKPKEQSVLEFKTKWSANFSELGFGVIHKQMDEMLKEANHLNQPREVKDLEADIRIKQANLERARTQQSELREAAEKVVECKVSGVSYIEIYDKIKELEKALKPKPTR